MSMCDSPLRELSNPGASGSIFYLTSDDEFIIKTVQHKEGEFLQKLLPGTLLYDLLIIKTYSRPAHFPSLSVLRRLCFVRLPAGLQAQKTFNTI